MVSAADAGAKDLALAAERALQARDPSRAADLLRQAERLAPDDLDVKMQLALALRRRELRDRQRAPVLPTSPAVDAHIRRLFPFRLTADQDKAVADVVRDLARERPMQRLLQADVGGVAKFGPTAHPPSAAATTIIQTAFVG